MMTTPTKTIGPLHFEDLEPKRFEDLVRQLAYDFRPWRVLEPTGRAGSDDGFDARGFEIVENFSAPEEPGDEDDPPAPVTDNDRQWLIQCKREKVITPGRLKTHLDNIASDERPRLHGLLFVAACDFSKTARDRFRAWCTENHISEAYLWGKGDIEDQLFQAKNDHLLFAYFGISLQIRQRRVLTTLRSKLSIKRKCERVLGKPNEEHYKIILLRDPTDTRYPYKPADSEEAKQNPFRWKVTYFLEHEPKGILVERRRFMAYIADDRIGWDCIEKIDDGELSRGVDPWSDKPQHDPEANKRWSFWADLPQPNQGWLKECELIKYEDILDIDEHGDRILHGPHVYIRLPRERLFLSFIKALDNFSSSVQPDPKMRISFFPELFPDHQSDPSV